MTRFLCTTPIVAETGHSDTMGASFVMKISFIANRNGAAEPRQPCEDVAGRNRRSEDIGPSLVGAARQLNKKNFSAWAGAARN